MPGSVFNRVDQIGETLESYVSLFASSPPLLGVLIGLWVAGLQLFGGGSPLVAFSITMPTVLFVQYSALLATKVVFEDEPKLSSTELLKRRYVEGAISHEEFDRRMEHMIAAEVQTDHTETISSASEYPGLSRDDPRTMRESTDSRR